MSTSAPPPPLHASSSTTAPLPTTTTSSRSDSKPEPSDSIHRHADIVLQLIHKQRAQASQAALADVESARMETMRVQGEVEEMKKGVGVLQEQFRSKSGEVDMMRHQLGRMSEEVSKLRRENAELRKGKGVGVGVGVGVVSPLIVNATVGGTRSPEVRNANANASIDPLGAVETKVDTEQTRWRLEELERENERLRAREANLQQRIEIFESLNAGTTLESTDSLPDLSGVLETLRAHGSGTSSQDDMLSKKRKLDETNDK